MILKVMSDQELIDGSIGRPVLNGKTYDNSFKIPKPYVNGLYDRSIFGSEKVGKCTCGLTTNKNAGTKVYCDVCKDLVFGDLDSYRNNYSYFELLIPVILIPKAVAFGDYLDDLLGTDIISNASEQKAINDIWSYSFDDKEPDEGETIATVRCGNGKLYVREVDASVNPASIGLIGLARFNGKNINGKKLELDQYVSTILPIISTYHRKMSDTIIGDKSRMELMTNKNLVEGYQTVIEITRMIKDENLLKQIHDPVELSNLYYNYNWAVEVCIEQIELLDNTKSHLTRDLARVSVKNSIYATLSPALDCDMNHIMVPRDITYPALDDRIMKKIKELYPEVPFKSEYRKGALGNSEIAEEAYQKVLEEATCLFWRNPTLHKYSMRAMKPISWNKPTIGVPLEVLKPMTADFDGDSCALIFQFDEVGDRMYEKMKSDNSWFYEKNDKPIFVFEHEILYGLAIASRTASKSKSKPTTYKNIEEADQEYKDNNLDYNELCTIKDKTTTYGRQKISNILEEDLDKIIGKDQIINENNVKDILVYMYKKENKVEMWDKLKHFGAEIVTREGMNTPFEDVYDFNDPQLKKVLEENVPNEEKLMNLNNYLKDTIWNKFVKKSDGNISEAAEVGARIKPSEITSLFQPDMRLDTKGELIFNTESSIFKGMSEEHLSDKGNTNRVVQSFKKSGTPSSGYITRQCVATLSRFTFSKKEDSSDKVGLLLPVELALGRTTIGGRKVTEKTPGDKNGKVRVKSNMFTKSYVVYADEVGTKILRGTNDESSIGIVLAETLTEQVSQGILSLKHGTGRDSKYDVVDVEAQTSGVVSEINSLFLSIVSGDGVLSKYRITNEMSVDKNVKEGCNVKKGDVILRGIREGKLGDKILKHATFLKFRVANDSYASGQMASDIEASVCYSPIDGVIDYLPNGNMTIDGKINIKVPQSAIPLFPSGYKCKKGERLFSSYTSVLDLNGYHDIMLSLSKTSNEADQETFDMMLKQAEEVDLPTKIPETYELLYKVISEKDVKFNTHNAPLHSDSFFDRIYYESKKQGIRSYITKETIKKKQLPVKDSIILDMLTAD